jgi:hypothetical protein
VFVTLFFKPPYNRSPDVDSAPYIMCPTGDTPLYERYKTTQCQKTTTSKHCHKNIFLFTENCLHETRYKQATQFKWPWARSHEISVLVKETKARILQPGTRFWVISYPALTVIWHATKLNFHKVMEQSGNLLDDLDPAVGSAPHFVYKVQRGHKSQSNK